MDFVAAQVGRSCHRHRPQFESMGQIEHAGAGGGLVITCGNVLQPGTLLENYLEARQAVRDYGGSAV